MAEPPDPQNAAVRLRTLTSLRPGLAFILGSGFNDALGGLEVDKEILYMNLPGFPGVQIDGHAGKVVILWLGKTELIVLQGRAHYYEGHSMAAITFPVRV